MNYLRGLAKKLQLSSEREHHHSCYLKNGGEVLEQLIALCDGNTRIPLRYFNATEIEAATKHHSHEKLFICNRYMVKASLENRLYLVSFVANPLPNSDHDICRDIAVTCQMSHLNNVLKLVGCCLEYACPVMVYQYIDAISLADLLRLNKSILSWESRLRIANQIASALVYLHTEFATPIIHADLHSQRVLIDQRTGVAKLFDFSFSVTLPPGKYSVETGLVRGTCGYIDPEYAVSSVVSQKMDVFGFGVILFQLLTGKGMYTIDGKIIDPNVKWYCVQSVIRDGCVMDLVDPVILREHGSEIQQQLEDYLNLVKRCTALKGEDRPYMIHVAKELRRIEKCYLDQD